MLKRILTAMALTSLLVTVALSVYWIRSVRGHSDEFSMGGNSDHRTHFVTFKNVVMVTSEEITGGVILSQTRPQQFKTLVGYSLLLPGIWVAIWVRSKLPRPGGRGRSDTPTSRRRGL